MPTRQAPRERCRCTAGTEIGVRYAPSWIGGLPIGDELAANLPRAGVQWPYREDVGSIIIVVATDAPLLPHQVQRLARRATMGLARTGSTSGNGSGDIFHRIFEANPNAAARATVQATEEAILNSTVGAETMRGRTVRPSRHCRRIN